MIKNDNRDAKLRTLFANVLKGKEQISNRTAKLFIEAISNQPGPGTCIQRLVASPLGLSSLREAWGFDNNASFFNGPAAELLHYLRDPKLRTVCGGEVLKQTVSTVVEVPLAWQSFVELAKSGKLEPRALEAFAWLLYQLLYLPPERAVEIVSIAQEPAIQQSFLKSTQVQIRQLGERIAKIANNFSGNSVVDELGPGGRHNNDFADIRNISILPTADELLSKDPYLPRVSDLEGKLKTPRGLALHIDAQFRLLREDMLRDLREEIEAATDPQPRRRRPLMIDGMSLTGIRSDEREPWSLKFHCLPDIPQLEKKNAKERKEFLAKNNRFLKHKSLACLMVDNDVITLATIIRDEELLAQKPPLICLKIPTAVVEHALLRVRTAKQNVKFIQLNTALFAYEPVLKQLQEVKELSLEADIVGWEEGNGLLCAPDYDRKQNLENLLRDLELDYSLELQHRLDLPNSTSLDETQAACFRMAMRRRVVLLHGPPGTGKSFMGSLIVKSIYSSSSETILIVCYTHHALDQFLEDLLKMGIPAKSIVRLGSNQKATAITKPLALFEQRSNIKFSSLQHSIIDTAKESVMEEGKSLQAASSELFNMKFSKSEIMEYLEFLSDGPSFYEAFEAPLEEMTRVGRKGKAIDKFFLLDRWVRGKDAGMFKRVSERTFPEIWAMSSVERIKALEQWKSAMLKETINRMHNAGKAYDSSLELSDSVFLEKDLAIMRQKRIIACTTTAAAKYGKALQSIAPGVLLVEEAGEILEGHILTALSPTTKHMILIGDHKQLRPKVHHDLSVEKGHGYDLNRSLFERLILRNYPHQALHQQHRMRPEISVLVRNLTYPELVDAPSTRTKPHLRGFLDNVMFVDHREAETDMPGTPEFVDNTSTSTKRNIHEAHLTLKCVRYLGQQGYRTENIVVLTPYLGQLRLLLDELAKDNDPVLNDLDSYNLVRAGLMPAATATVGKPRIRISTIDNFQGDESDVAVISLTRSNVRRDIGFMSSPERLNVLLSRAREGLIMIGDAQHFSNARKGASLWQRLFKLLKDGKHIYDGFPVRCERHKDRTAILRHPGDFDSECPDGGCKERCGKLLSCDTHQCPQRCHQLYDHSKMKCQHEVEFNCPNGHTRRCRCFQVQNVPCAKCQADADKKQRELETDRVIQEKRDSMHSSHAAEIADLEQQIKKVRAEAAGISQADAQAKVLAQKRRDLAEAQHQLRMRTAQQKNSASNRVENHDLPSKRTVMPPREGQNASSERAVTAQPGVLSDSEAEWQRQKQIEGASNDAIDSLMKLTGLEQVKAKVLDIKAKIETVARQGLDMSKERLGMVMLGNPGTGKTTVARLYGQFLAAANAIPGREFVEVTGSNLASQGVADATKKIEDLLKAGGGIFFLDEAYQLANGNSFNGSAVLDYLLAEIEEQRGKIVFVLAGYKKEMEKFFEHNPGFDSRMPHQLLFEDYSDTELQSMLCRMVETKYSGQARLEDGNTGLYCRILIKRLGRLRGKEGYGNARALENVWATVTERQASRIRHERANGTQPDDLFFAKEDMIGPEPSQAIQNCAAWKELNSMIGLASVKGAVKTLLDRIRMNYHRELHEKSPVEVSLNRVFLGSPGTGKTTVAKLYGAILAALGLLSKGEVVTKNPADFVGSVLGESEKNTKAILKVTEGKVLVIDEAYMLSPGSTGGVQGGDIYKKAVVDTMMTEIQSNPGEDRCVLLLGYRDEMTEMLRTANIGLARRFPIEDAFQFDDFNDTELRQILDHKLKKQDIEASPAAKDTAINVLARLRDRPNFGNAGAVENLLSKAKETWQKRASSSTQTVVQTDIVLSPRDFDEKFDRFETSAASVKRLFSDIVGCPELVKKLERYQRMAAGMRSRNQDPRDLIPFNFVFKGPPGTGKTTVARKIAKLFFEIGILSTDNYKECSAADLVAPFVGQSAPRAREMLREALGKVLFVDEAYRLQDSEFGREAVNEIVDSLTKPEFMGKLVVILAGYTNDMNSLLSVNPGLSSRFSEEVLFENMAPCDCLILLKRELRLSKLEVASDLTEPGNPGHQTVLDRFQELATLDSWGNGRDVKTLSKRIASSAFEHAGSGDSSILVSVADTLRALDIMLQEQKARSSYHATHTNTNGQLGRLLTETAEMMQTQPNIVAKSSCSTSDPEPVVGNAMTSPPAKRDANVPEEIWAQLQRDIKASQELEESRRAALKAGEEAVQQRKKEQSANIERIRELEQARKADCIAQVQEDEMRREAERLRLEAVALKRAQGEEEERLRQLRQDEEKRRRKEARAQKKLREMGVCPVGFRWIKQAGGYRCAGGSHFVPDSALNI